MVCLEAAQQERRPERARRVGVGGERLLEERRRVEGGGRDEVEEREELGAAVLQRRAWVGLD